MKRATHGHSSKKPFVLMSPWPQSLTKFVERAGNVERMAKNGCGRIASARVARPKHFTAETVEEQERQVSEKVDVVVPRVDGRRGGRVGGWERE